ncbi:Zinc finger protein 91 [Eumeta japonica]|uniref:Zinc finger protein 91 n=1 Tax=Eumeta variegata TaxID=151549 RepID=A0A4C1XQR7_EUMVA|nr:Zinc finger protein 91 [Eumeta japonica]
MVFLLEDEELGSCDFWALELKREEQFVSDKLKICWECKIHLQKFDLFIERVQSNFTLLHHSSDLKKGASENSIADKYWGMWTKELVSEEQLHEWRNADVNMDRYQRLHRKCTTCLVAFNYEEQLLKHNLKYHCETLGPYLCDVCQARFAQEVLMKKHRQEHLTLYKCLVCQFSCRAYVDLKKHLIDEHVEASIQCDQCDAVFNETSNATSNEVALNVQRYHGGGMKALALNVQRSWGGGIERDRARVNAWHSNACALCTCYRPARALTTSSVQYSNARERETERYTKVVSRREKESESGDVVSQLEHGNLPKEQCHICKKTYKNKYTLKWHMKVHAVTKETYYCAPCDIHFKSALIYKRHIAHSIKHLKPEDLKYKCEECDRRFVTEKQKQAHHETIHLKKGQFACDKCSKCYSTRRGLKYHTALKHDGGYVEPPRDKICDICGRAFPSKTILTSHIRTHTGERPYKCELCPSTFTQSGALYTHRKLVHEKVKRRSAGKKAKSPRECRWEDEKYTY